MALVVAILGFWPAALEPFAPLKAVFLRGIGLGLLVWVGAEAWAGRVRRPGALTLAVAGWVVVSALATALSWSPRLSFVGELGQREGMLLALALAGLHVAAAHAHRDERQVRTTLLTLLLAGVGAALHAQLQLAGLDPLSADGVRTHAVHGGLALLPTGPLGDPRLLGVVLAVVLPVALARLAETRSDATWLVPATALLAASLVTTLAREAWFAAAIGSAVALAAALVAGAPVGRVAWTTAVSLLPALVLATVAASDPSVSQLAGSLDAHAPATREIIVRGAFQLWSERPWSGVGPDAFGFAYPRVQELALWRDGWVALPVQAPTVALQLLATLGVLGVLAGLAWVVAAGRGIVVAWLGLPAARATLAGLAGAFAALLLCGLFGIVGLAGAAMFALCSALPAAIGGRPALAVKPVRPVLPGVFAAAAVLLCVLELASGVREIPALTLARSSRDAGDRARFTPSEWRALTRARELTAWNAAARLPHEAALWRLACDASLAAGEAAGPAAADTVFLAAERAARRLVTLEPNRAANLERLGKARAARAAREGNAVLADSMDVAFERASRLAPADGRLLGAQGRAHLALRNGARAFEVAQKLIGLYPEAAAGYTLSGAALLLLGRDDDARASLLRAHAARWEAGADEQRAAVARLLERLEKPPAAGQKSERRQGPMAAPRP